jgi:hypothetical protein
MKIGMITDSPNAAAVAQRAGRECLRDGGGQP